MERERFPFLVSIVQEQVSYFGVVYERELLGFGCRTAEEREVEVAKVLARENARLYPALAVKGGPSFEPGTMVTRKHRAVFRESCEVCKVTGVKPGCKRKKCEACGGVGSVGTEPPARMF